MESYLKFSFSSTIFISFPSLAKQWFVHVMKHRRMMNRHLLQRLVLTCCNGCWSTHFNIACQYIEYITSDLLLYQEPATTHLHESERVYYGSKPKYLVRVIVLWCLEREINKAIVAIQMDGGVNTTNKERIHYINSIVTTLLKMNFLEEWIDDYMPTSNVHRTKMRCWQALCTLSKLIISIKALTNDYRQLFQEYITMTSDIILQNNHATIRYYVELFLARLLTGGGQESIISNMNECLLKPLRTIDSSTKSVASILVVVLHSSNDIARACDSNNDFRSSFISTVLPLLGSSSSQIRILSQIIMHRMYPEGYEKEKKERENDSLRNVIVPILKFLREQKDMIRMRLKQEKLFTNGEKLFLFFFSCLFFFSFFSFFFSYEKKLPLPLVFFSHPHRNDL